jgi:hypothetical protein
MLSTEWFLHNGSLHYLCGVSAGTIEPKHTHMVRAHKSSELLIFYHFGE